MMNPGIARGPSLFRQVAVRLIAVAATFAVLDISLVV